MVNDYKIKIKIKDQHQQTYKDFKNITYQVQYKDKDGIVIGDDYVYLENFDSKSKQKIKLTPYEEGVESIVLTTDWFENK